MPAYTYIAIDGKTGKEERGDIAGDSEAAVVAELKGRGLYPMQLDRQIEAGDSPVGAAEGKPRRKRRSFGGGSLSKTRTVLTRQLATLLKAGMPLLRSLEVLERQQLEDRSREMLGAMAETIRGGGKLSDAMARHPKYFDALYLNMIKAGEAAGALPEVLARLADYLEKSRKIQGQIKAAMVYPIIIMTVATAVVGALVVFVVPKFESIFANMLRGESLPALTQVVINLSSYVKDYYLFIAVGLVALIWGLRVLGRTAMGGRVIDRLFALVPVVSDLVIKAAVARFARTLSTLLTSGVQILDALRITRDTAGNTIVAGALNDVRERVRAGEGVAKPLAATGVFPEMVAGMVEVGEDTGDLPGMLSRVADTYDEEVDQAVSAFTSLLEPLMIVIMAVVVGTIVIALFLPLARLIQGLS